MSLSHGLTNHPIFKIWMKIKERCYSKNCKDYQNYGGRGVVVCDEWKNDFKVFYDWAIINGWEKGLQIDKDIKGDGMLYSPDTCIFVTSLENNRHQRTTKLTQEKADEIRRLYLTGGYTQKELSLIFGVRQPSISETVLNNRWPQIGYTPKKSERKQRGNISNSMMNICRENKVSYWALIHRIKDGGATFEAALKALIDKKKSNL